MVLLALLYASMIFVGFHTLILSSVFMFVVMTSGVLMLSGLAAWRNVRFWYREGTDYEKALKEDAATPRKLHIVSDFMNCARGAATWLIASCLFQPIHHRDMRVDFH